jgi:Transposase.
MLKEKPPKTVAKNKIYKVCIDNFAFKRRYTYGTIMVDIEPYRILDLLDFREKESVTQWFIYLFFSNYMCPNAHQMRHQFQTLAFF